MQCSLCNTQLKKRLDEEYFECTICGGIVKDATFLPDAAEEKQRYLLHNNDVEDLRYQEFTAPIWNYVLSNFTAAQQGLDFGSGPGPVISKILQEHNYKVDQYDPYFADYPELLTRKYDYILCCEVIEHFYDPHREFLRFKQMLKPGGELICMTLLYDPEQGFQNWHYRKDPTHVFIYQKKTVELIARTYNFKDFSISGGRLLVWRCAEE